MDSFHTDASLPADDLSALAWVQDELRKSLDAAHKALHRALKDQQSAEQSDVDALDPSVLRTARQQIHQGVGALELAGLPAGAALLRASEAVVQKFVNRPSSLNADAVRDIERASFALLDYMARRVAGKVVSAVELFPQYEALVQRGGGPLPRPSDLWSQDWPALSLESTLQAPSDVDPRKPDADAVEAFETGLLKLLRKPQADDARTLAGLCVALARDAEQRRSHRESATWMLASGFFEGLAEQRIELSVHAKRVLSSLLSQLRVLVKGQGVPSDRLASELLFFCAQAEPTSADDHSVLHRVRHTFGLEKHRPVSLVASSLGRHDPAWIAQALKRVTSAKEGWSSVAAGEVLRLGGLNEQFSLVGDSLRRLFPDGDVLADALGAAVQRTVNSSQAPEPGLAMEVATSLLYVEACLEDAEFDQPEQRERVHRLAERIQRVSLGELAPPLEAWMEDLYRRVSDRQTIGSVVQELRATLSECEKHIDQFFRDPQDRTPLVNVPSQLQSMRGVLAVLGLDLAAHATVRMRDDVDHLLSPESDLAQAAQAGVFDRLASNLGALGFLIDMMGVQPALAKSLFSFDEDSGVLSPLMGREKKIPLTPDDPVEAAAHHVHQVEKQEAKAVAEEVAQTLVQGDASLEQVSEQLQKLVDTPHVQDQAELADNLAAAQAALDQALQADDAQTTAAAREQVAQVLADLTQPEPDVAEPEPFFPPAAPLVPTPVVEPEATGLEEDDEMREIFLEEAREVVAQAREGLAELVAQPADIAGMTAVRRAFHTLKGSSRMVGLKEYGEAAWACEQLYNAWLAAQQPADGDLLGLTGEVLDHMAAWTEAIASRQDAGWASGPVVLAADALRLRGERVSLNDAVAAPADVVVAEVPAPPDAHGLPSLSVTESEPEVDWLTLSLSDPHHKIQPVAYAPAEDTVRAHPLSLPAEPALGAAPSVADTSIDVPVNVAEPDADAPLALSLPDVEDTSPQSEYPVDAATDLDLSVDAAPPVLALSEGEALSLRPDEGEAAASVPALPTGEALVLDDPLADPAWIDPLADPLADPARWGDAPDAPDLVLLDEPLPSHFEAGEGVFPVPTVDEVVVAEPLAAVDEVLDDAPAVEADEQVKVIGPLRISIPLFNIYLNEADEQSRRLCTALNEWALEPARTVDDEPIALAHSLAGNSATVGYHGLSGLARLLEHALTRAQILGEARPEEVALFNQAGDEIRQLLHQFAAGFLREPSETLLEQLEDYDHAASRMIEARSLAALDEPTSEPLPLDGMGDEGPADHPHLRLVHSTGPAPLTLELGEVHAEAPAVDLPLDEPAVSVPGAFDARPDAHQDTHTHTSPSSLMMQWDDDDDIDAQDLVDAELFPIFEEEAQELLPQLAAEVRQWHARPEDTTAASACMRTLHTFKGGARLAGAMRLGELAHRLESTIEHLLADNVSDREAIAPLEARVDRIVEVFEALRERDHAQAESQTLAPVSAPVAHEPAAAPFVPAPPLDAAALDALTVSQLGQLGQLEQLSDGPDRATADIDLPLDPSLPADALGDGAAPSPVALPPDSVLMPVAPAPVEPLPAIQWASLPGDQLAAMRPTERESAQGPSQAAVRVRPQLLDRLVNQAGEVAITRTRLQGQVGQIRGSLHDLTDNLDRLRQQLRDIELQAETQLSTRMEAARAAAQQFDPLEFDRYTRFQELTRMMAESVNDVATVQRTLQRSLETTEDQLAAQARLTRDLQDDLLRTRMVEFEGLSERLYRVVRQAAKETGKHVRLDIVGGSTEVDRGVLERMTGAFEHLLRNCVTHGIELPDDRAAAGKDATGTITVTLTHEGNEVGIAFSDDGAGLRLDRIRDRAVKLGLIQPDAPLSDGELAQLIFTPGFSTADQVTELAGRGVGMDVVRAEVNAMGGRIETQTQAGQGTRFTLILPLTTAVTRVVMLRCGQINVAVPTHLIEMVRRAKPAEVERAYHEGHLPLGDQVLPFYWLGSLLEFSPMGLEGGRSLPIVVVRSAQQRIAVHVDEVLGNQEVVVKNLGSQLARMPGLAGMTLLASGAVSLIYNPVALATVYGDAAQTRTREALQAPQAAAGGWLQPDAKPVRSEASQADAGVPMVLVVDDSLTVRRVTQRLLLREGYRVVLAKDGLEALELLAQERPTVVLSDIEMPRMDGFDLVRNIRADQKLADLPVIMITSRIAQKHRDYAAELGVNHYLGKPYREDELLALVARYASPADVVLP